MVTKSGALFQLITQCNAKYVECFSAQKECNKEKNRNSSVVPGKTSAIATGCTRSSKVHCAYCVRTQPLPEEMLYNPFNLGSLRQIDVVDLDASKSCGLSDLKSGFDMPQNVIVFQLEKWT